MRENLLCRRRKLTADDIDDRGSNETVYTTMYQRQCHSQCPLWSTGETVEVKLSKFIQHLTTGWLIYKNQSTVHPKVPKPQ